jgi:hypothetical protein
MDTTHLMMDLMERREEEPGHRPADLWWCWFWKGKGREEKKGATAGFLLCGMLEPRENLPKRRIIIIIHPRAFYTKQTQRDTTDRKHCLQALVLVQV